MRQYFHRHQVLIHSQQDRLLLSRGEQTNGQNRIRNVDKRKYGNVELHERRNNKSRGK